MTVTRTFARMSKSGLLACGAIILALPFGAAEAQDGEAAAEDGEAIIITGSRIRTDGMQAPVPVTVVQAAELEALSPGALITGVSQLPQFYGNQTPNSGNFFTRSGYGSLNLRGLGTNRTLTLLNGRRVPSTSAFGGVDINLFPEAMLQSVETTTGGASAAYGSDAVAGVVNFTLDTNFTGLELSAQGGVTDRGDGENYELSAAFGTEFAGGRGHFLASGEYYNQQGIFDYSGRDWYQAYGTFGTGSQADPFRFVPNTVSANASFDGRIVSPNAAINRLAFNASGNVAAFVPGTLNQGDYGTAAARTAGGGNDDAGSDIFTLTPDLKRYSAFAYADFELSENLSVFAQYLHGKTETFTPIAFGNLSGGPTTLTIFQDNAFLPASLRQTMVANNIASFTLRRRGHSSDIGNGYYDDATTQHIGTAGFNADVGNGWEIDGFYQYGRSTRVWDQFGLRVDRIFAAADAVRDPANPNNIVCRVSTFAAGAAAFPGCQPINLFGRGNASAAAVDYVTGFESGVQVTTPIYFAEDGYASGDTYSYTSGEAKRATTTFQQHFAELSTSGDLVDLWAGPLAVALGGSWRRDSIRQLIQDVTNPTSNHDLPFTSRVDPGGVALPRPVRCSDPALGLRGVSVPDCNNTVGVQFSKVSNIRGISEVWEGFGEVLLPLYDSNGFSAVTNAAVRWADYSGSGSVWAYKGGLELGFMDDALRLRGTYSRDVRAANLSERFDKTGGTAIIDDPRTTAVEALTITRFSGGNPGVLPEEADTFTVGAVFRPSFISGLSMSLDYYDIKIAGAISQVGNQAVLNRCFLEKAQEFCDLITLDSGIASPTSTGSLILVGDVFVNVAEAGVRGVDFETSYRTDLNLMGGEESLDLRLFASWLLERSETSSTGATTDFAGQTGATQGSQVYQPYADFKATAGLTYRNGGFSSLLQVRYTGEGYQDVCGVAGRCPVQVYLNDNTVDDVAYIDLRLGYDFDLGGAELQVFGNITNLTDVDPPLTPSYSPFLGYSSQINTAVYDVLGRRFTVGAKLRL